MKRRYRVAGAVALLLLVMVMEAGLSTRQKSASWDEGDHIYAGYMNWKHREYSLNPEHPPLVKLVATLPLLPLDLKVAPRQEAAALEYEQKARVNLKKDPREALSAARSAVALVPDSFDTNIALGDAFATTGNPTEARTAYAIAMGRLPEMEPTAQEHWRPILEKKLADVVSTGRGR